MDKIVIFGVLVFLGLFLVLVFNYGKENNNLASVPSLSVTPTQNPSPTFQAVNTISPSPSNFPLSPETMPKTAVIKTAKGDIEVSLYSTDAPNTVANFLQKAKSGFYNNLVFHRVEDWVIQGGDPLGNGTGGGNMPVEFNTKPFIVGSLGVASRGDGKVQNDAQFFITKTDASWLNGQYTNFGIVTKGIDVVNKIEINDKILGITL
ncbi:MAG: peptidylprolyl isomerase [Patescibacteria group bacterium]